MSHSSVHRRLCQKVQATSTDVVRHTSHSVKQAVAAVKEDPYLVLYYAAEGAVYGVVTGFVCLTLGITLPLEYLINIEYKENAKNAAANVDYMTNRFVIDAQNFSFLAGAFYGALNGIKAVQAKQVPEGRHTSQEMTFKLHMAMVSGLLFSIASRKSDWSQGTLFIKSLSYTGLNIGIAGSCGAFFFDKQRKNSKDHSEKEKALTPKLR